MCIRDRDNTIFHRMENQRSNQFFSIKYPKMDIGLIPGEVFIFQIKPERMTEHKVAQVIFLGITGGFIEMCIRDRYRTIS